MSASARARFPALAPHVLAALPAHDAPPLTAREIHRACGYGSPSVVRMILRLAVADGGAIAETAPPRGSCAPAKLFRRAG